MNITDELRKWARQFRRVWVDPHSGDLTYITNEHACPPSLDAVRLEDYITAIADRIDAEHERAMEEARAEGMQEGFVADKGPREFIELPKDADGEPIHIGDEMEWPTTGETFEVVGIGDGTLFYIEDGSELADWTGASTKRHHHAPTVEDVLDEIVDKANAVGVAYASNDMSGDEMMDALHAIIADYASKLQLREDA